MNGGPMDRSIRELARDLRRPPPTPREEMWSHIQERLASRAAGRRPLGAGSAPGSGRPGLARTPAVAGAGVTGAWTGWAVAAAAALVVSLGVGRLTAPGADPGIRTADGSTVGSGAAAEAAHPADGAVYAVAVRHLERTEALLSLVRADAGTGRLDPELRPWARGLLLETRLLLDAPDAPDPTLTGLLEDLELFLAQVTVMARGGPDAGERGRQDLRLIADGLEEQDVLTRIRTVLAGSESVIL